MEQCIYNVEYVCIMHRCRILEKCIYNGLRKYLLITQFVQLQGGSCRKMRNYRETFINISFFAPSLVFFEFGINFRYKGPASSYECSKVGNKKKSVMNK